MEPKFRRNSRHIINASIQFSAGDFRPTARNRHATLYIGDMGMQLSTTDDSEMHQKYGVRALNRRRWGFNNRSHCTMGYSVQTTGGIAIQYSWNKMSMFMAGMTKRRITSKLLLFRFWKR